MWKEKEDCQMKKKKSEITWNLENKMKQIILDNQSLTKSIKRKRNKLQCNAKQKKNVSFQNVGWNFQKGVEKT